MSEKDTHDASSECKSGRDAQPALIGNTEGDDIYLALLRDAPREKCHKQGAKEVAEYVEDVHRRVVMLQAQIQGGVQVERKRCYTLFHNQNL